MRLICPNCGAQYEIDASLVPADGRDVQCSSCGHTWFQRRETVEDDLADEAGVTVPEPDVMPRPQSDRPPEAETAPPVEAPSAEEPPLEEPPAPQTRPRKPDETAIAILREEAEREAEARRREAQGLETQGDLGLSGTAPGSAVENPAKARAIAAASAVGPSMARTDPIPDDSPVSSGRGSDIFPDIEEINSSLSTAEREALAEREAAVAAENEKSSRMGFRVGFLTVVTFVAVLIVLYAFAPRLSENFPGLRPALADYVSWANARRDQVEGLMQSATSMIGGN